MDYAAFKAYIARFLWKQNDLELVADLDSLILMANSELNAKLDVQRRDRFADLTPTTNDVALPDDFRTMHSVTPTWWGQMRPLSKSNPAHIIGLRNGPHPTLVNSPFYATAYSNTGTVLMLPLTTEVSGVTLRVHYRCDVPNYAVEDASWIADTYLDLYVYTVLAHCAPFLMQDERVQLWVSMRDAALTAALVEDRHRVQFGGSPLAMQPHHYSP